MKTEMKNQEEAAEQIAFRIAQVRGRLQEIEEACYNLVGSIANASEQPTPSKPALKGASPSGGVK